MGESPEPIMTVAAIVAGAGTSGAISGVVKGIVPEIAPDIAAAVVGGLLWWFGDRIHPLVKAYGVGVLAGGLKGTIEKAIPTITGGGGGQGGAQAAGAKAQPTGDVLAQLAQAQASIPIVQG